MTAAKEIKSEGVPLMVEIDEIPQLPAAVHKAVQSFGSYPYVVFSDPSGSHVYGAFEYKQLKSGDYRSVFRDVKKDIRAAQQDGSIVSVTPETGGGAKPKGGSAQGEPGGSSDGLLTRRVITGQDFESWTSAKGSAIKGRLIGVQPGGVYVFELTNGREIKASEKQLAPESVFRLQEIVDSL
ncbi:MAG: hypothetical protein Q7Q71_06590 [Verrucomicrobiota bacterium JB023]|nr:hypothetical protein [Verrucomicrobiota bacterium JB023]